MSRSKRWTELHDDMKTWWHKVTAARAVPLAKAVDATLAWRTHIDLRSIHANEYRRPDDDDVRTALIEARAATKRLSYLLWEREQRLRREQDQANNA